MKSIIHREMAFQVLSDFPNPQLLEFLIEGVAKKEWKKSRGTKERFLKDWMDMPDSNKHGSKLKNDHSYKLRKTDKGFKVEFAKTGGDQATVVARLKYAARDIKEWKEEEEYRVCALELAKSIHWLIDVSSPSHTLAGWTDKLHSRLEKDFDRIWRPTYTSGQKQIVFSRKNRIKDIYRWAMDFARASYDRNARLLEVYQQGGSILKGKGVALGREVILDIAQNLADYLAFTEKRIALPQSLAGLKAE
jgi:hypothetical protein